MTVRTVSRLSVGIATLLLLMQGVAGQSSSQTSPSPVEVPEISVQIKPRDIGDSRNTTYYFELAASQGDLFINVVATNFSGDIDFFTVAGLKPLAKIMVYGGQEPWETGRVVYFRQNERVLLRIEGRTPNDDPSSLRIKFAGSFVAVKGTSRSDASEPTVRRPGGGERVSSVGASRESESDKSDETKGKEKRKGSDGKGTDTSNAEGRPRSEASATAASESPNLPAPSGRDRGAVKSSDGSKTAAEKNGGANSETAPPGKADSRAGKDVAVERGKTSKPPSGSDKKSEGGKGAATEVRKPNVRSQIARITLRDGKVLTYSMSDVSKIGVEDGTLNINTKSGSRLRVPLSEVQEVSIK